MKVVGVGGRPILEEMVTFSSECLSKYQEDTAAKGTGIGRGTGERGRPFADGLVDTEWSWVGEDACSA